MTFSESKILSIRKAIKITSVLLAISAVITFFACSKMLYTFSVENAYIYERNLKTLNAVERPICKGMVKVGEVQTKLVLPRNQKKAGYDIFSDISRKHNK